MTEQDLLYHFPYRVDKEHNFRNYELDSNKFVLHFIPDYDGTNVREFVYHKSNLSKTEILDFEYIYENFRKWLDWYSNGKNIFSFSKELLSMLKKTDVDEITPECFHLPYDIFYISLKPLNIKISKGRGEIIEGVYIDYNIWSPVGEHPEGYCDLSFYFVGDFKTIFDGFLPTVKSRIEDTLGHFEETPLGSFWNIWLNFEKKEGRVNIKQAIEYFKKDLKKEIFLQNGSQDIVTDYELDFYYSSLELLDNTLNLVINCLLYLSQPFEKKDIEFKLPKGLPNNFDKKASFAKTAKELKKIENKIELLGFTKIHYVGQTFKIKYDKILNCSSVQPHWRRGHWRNQKFGKKLIDRKIIWISPIIVNNKNGEPLKGHIYDLKEESTNNKY